MARPSFDAEYSRAVRRGKIEKRGAPRAQRVRYERRSRRIVVDLVNGAAFSFPPELAQGLAGASAADLAQVEISPSGLGLHWSALNADFSLPQLMKGVFGTSSWMTQLTRRAPGNTTAKARTKGRMI